MEVLRLSGPISKTVDLSKAQGDFKAEGHNPAPAVEVLAENWTGGTA
jgi:hypothetical protein